MRMQLKNYFSAFGLCLLLLIITGAFRTGPGKPAPASAKKPGVIYIYNTAEGKQYTFRGVSYGGEEPFYIKFNRDSAWLRINSKDYIRIIVPPGRDTILDLQIDHNINSKRHIFVPLNVKSNDTVYYTVRFTDFLINEVIKLRKVKPSKAKRILRRCRLRKELEIGVDIIPR
jgi:hypothetical protein